MKMMYPDAVEPKPHNIALALGKPIHVNTFIDAGHAGNKVTRRYTL